MTNIVYHQSFCSKSCLCLFFCLPMTFYNDNWREMHSDHNFFIIQRRVIIITHLYATCLSTKIPFAIYQFTFAEYNSVSDISHENWMLIIRVQIDVLQISSSGLIYFLSINHYLSKRYIIKLTMCYKEQNLIIT